MISPFHLATVFQESGVRKQFLLVRIYMRLSSASFRVAGVGFAGSDAD
jgi:hypothetical protein